MAVIPCRGGLGRGVLGVLGREGRPAGPPGGAGRRRPQAAGNRRRRFALRAGLRVCRGLRRGGRFAGGGREGRGKGWTGGCGGGGQGRRPNRPEDGFGGRSPPAPAEPGRPAALSPPLRKMSRGATGTGKRYRRRGSGGGVPGSRPPCRGSRRRCAGR